VRKKPLITGLCACALAFGIGSRNLASAAPSAQSQSCSERATGQGLKGEERDKFESACTKGSLSPDRPTTQVHHTAAANALVKPSGADRTRRSSQCNAEGARRGLKDSGLQAFRKGCLASAAPVQAIETSTRDTKPTPAKPKLDALTDAPRH
jgi:hypothetical protein